MADYWRWYVGTLDQALFDWFAAQRPARKTGIVSNSGPGAREAERRWGFEDDHRRHRLLPRGRPAEARPADLHAGRGTARRTAGGDRLPRRRRRACRGGPRGGVPGRRAPFDPRVHRRDRGRDRGRAAPVKDLPEGPLRLGPVLRYVDATSATIWVETQEAAEVVVEAGDVTARAGTFRAHGHHYALVEVAGLPPGTPTPYRVLVDGAPVWPPDDPDLAEFPAPVIPTLEPGQAAAHGVRLLPGQRLPRRPGQRGLRGRRAAGLRVADGRTDRGAPAVAGPRASSSATRSTPTTPARR